MLNPFMIRDLDEYLPLLRPEGFSDHNVHSFNQLADGLPIPRSRPAIVQLSAADYDEIATTHPQARLSYLDDDDGDVITVGSGLELSQRLDEPPPSVPETGHPETVHIFDIKRSKSVADLWKKFEVGPPRTPINNRDANVVVDDAPTMQGSSAGTGWESGTQNEQAYAAGEDTSEPPLLSAFEAELAKILRESHSPTDNSPAESTASSATARAESTSYIPQDTPEAFASALRNLIEVADSVGSGLRSRIPELERHLENARRALPGDITDSLKHAFSMFENQVTFVARTVSNLPESIRRENGPGSHPAFPNFPDPLGAIHGLREMGMHLGNLGESLLDAFEAAARGNFPTLSNTSNRPSDGLSGDATSRGEAPSLSPDVSSSQQAPSHAQDHLISSMETPSQTSPQLPEVAGAPEHQQPLNDQRSVPDERIQPPHHSRFWTPHSRPHSPAPLIPWNNPGYPPHPPPFPRPSRCLHSSPIASMAHQPPPRTVFNPPRAVPPRYPRTFHWRGNRASQPSQHSLFVGNVGFNVTEKMINDVLVSKGFLQVEVKLPLDSRTGKHAGFGYLNFASAEGAKQAIRELQGMIIDGHSINLEYVDHVPLPEHLSFEGAEGSGFNPGSSSSALGDTGNNTVGANASGSSASRSDSVLDLSDTFNSMLYPPLTPARNQTPQPSSEIVSNCLSNLGQAEARFPPVSQRDAHRLAVQEPPQRNSMPSNSTGMTNGGGNSEGCLTRNAPTSQALPGSFPQDALDDPRPESTTECQSMITQSAGAHSSATTNPPPPPPPHLHHHHHHHHPHPYTRSHPRRAATVRSIYSQRRYPDLPEPGVPALRRRATERHSLRNGPQAGPGGPRHRASFHDLPEVTLSQSQGTNASGEETSGWSKRQRAIDECIAALAQLGYGGEADGGDQRMAVYAAATNGELLDAIEMIEEERKAYEQQRANA